jgi:hypoxanthine phosphoribosyltransferase
MSADEHEVTIFSQAKIARRVKAIARDIAKRPLRPDIAVPILAGAFVFAADLLRALAREGLDLETEFIWLRSYGRSEAPGDVTVLKAPTEIVRGRTVLLIDGVLDRGVTMACAKHLLEEADAAAIVAAVAVVKTYPRPLFTADYTLFTAGPEFIFGYGMDRAGLGRGVPDIRVKREERGS